MRGALVTFCGGAMLAIKDEMNGVSKKLGRALGGAPYLGFHSFGEQGTLPNGVLVHGNLMFSTLIFSNRRKEPRVINEVHLHHGPTLPRPNHRIRSPQPPSHQTTQPTHHTTALPPCHPTGDRPSAGRGHARLSACLRPGLRHPPERPRQPTPREVKQH